jgi:PAT family beta-lactamase induction signal transducer AmpG
LSLLSIKTAISSTFSVYLERSVIRLFFLGFSAGLPILLVFSSLSFWLREAGIDRATIGYMSWAALAYGFKWIWSPAVDKVQLPIISRLLGRRRSWLLLTQVCLIISIGSMAMINPKINLYYVPLAAIAVAFFSATQDIVIDAFRIESGDDKQQAAMAATYQIGYRFAMIVASAGVLLLAATFETSTTYDYSAWQKAYLIMALLMGVGLLTTLLSPEPDVSLKSEDNKKSPATSPISFILMLREAYVTPLLEIVSRYKWHAVVLIILIATYRISDIVMGVMANVFYVDMGYTKSDIALASKTYGLIMTLTGALLAGSLVNKYGVLKILLIGSILSALTNILFIFLSQSDYNLTLLYTVISVDNLSAGLATTAFIAFLSSLASKEFTATQYAFLSSAMLLFPKFLGGFSGVWLESLGYTYFFSMTAILGLPTAVAILYLMKQKWHA